MAGLGGPVPPRRAIKALLSGAALAFALAGFTRALTVAIAAHTESAVIRNGGLASIGPTSRGLAILGVVLAIAAAVLGYRWIQRLALIPAAAPLPPTASPSVALPEPPPDDRPLPHGVRLVLPAGLAALDRRLSGTSSGLFRSLAILAWLATAVATVVALAGVVGGFAWGEAGMASGLRHEILAFGAATVAALAAIWIVDRLGESAADRSSPYATPIPTRRRGARALPLALLLAVVLYPAVTVMVAGAREVIHCPGLPGGDCRLVTVALDHRHPEDARTLNVIYRVVAARAARLGTLVVAVGGPGVRGLSEADPWLGLADPAIRDHYDIVFFDQRGVGGSGGPDCGNAVRAYQATARGDRVAIDRAFVQACLAELGGAAASLLPYDSTWEAAADVDAIRVALGLDRIAIYGESYGTRLAQAYAALYPGHVSALVLDGAIDPATVGLPFWRESAHGFEAVLEAALAGCAADAACRADVAGGDPLAAFERQLATVSASPVPIDYPTGFDLEHLALEPAVLIDATSLALYDVQTRMELQRAVAAASHDDWLPWARLVKATRPEPVTSRLDAAAWRGPWPAAHLGPWTPAAYLAVECADIDAPALADGLAAFRAAAQDPALDAGPFAGIVYQDAPCLGWPRPVDGLDPRPPTVLGVPTLVLAATTDPITPLANAERIVQRSPGAGLVVTTGGPHVTYLRGDSCVDGAVRRFLVDGEAPEPRIDCPGRVAAPYVPRIGSASSFADTDAGIHAVAAEIGALPEVTTWDGLGTFRIGCDAGGYLTVYGFPDEINLLVARCAFVPGFVLDGTGTMDPATRRVSLSVSRLP